MPRQHINGHILEKKPPTELPKYLKEFAHPDTKIIDGPEISSCKGVGNCCHAFLSADGFSFCLGCNEMVCMHCQDRIGDQIYCLVCYSQESLVPFHGEELGKTVIEMREELASKYNFDSVDQLTIQDVEDYYEVRQVANARHIDLSINVPFPLYESNKMGNFDSWTNLTTIDFSEGAVFIGDPDLDP